MHDTCPTPALHLPYTCPTRALGWLRGLGGPRGLGPTAPCGKGGAKAAAPSTTVPDVRVESSPPFPSASSPMCESSPPPLPPLARRNKRRGPHLAKPCSRRTINRPPRVPRASYKCPGVHSGIMLGENGAICARRFAHFAKPRSSRANKCNTPALHLPYTCPGVASGPRGPEGTWPHRTLWKGRPHSRRPFHHHPR